MKPRHAAALALIVWYLIFPPFSKKNQFGIWHADPSAALLKWDFYTGRYDFTPNDRAHALEFKTYDECEHERKGIYDGWFGTKGHRGLKDTLQWNSIMIDRQTEVVMYEKCVASDDPRLKAN